jgi:hypothetical protein
MVTRVPFERGWTDLAKARMATSLVIEHLDVIEQLHLRLAFGGEVLGELSRRNFPSLHCRSSCRSFPVSSSTPPIASFAREQSSV